ncbi:MAG TPA: hypothetical protein VJ483_04695, partial [Holophagaceae bacterium]|nr:hypothetical protein [Holophagaceae bacterium]
MQTSSLLEVLAREHPAFVHVPLGLVAVLPLAILLSFRKGASAVWTRTAFFLTAVALAGSLLAAGSGLMWARQIGLIPPGAWLPRPASTSQTLQRLLQLHELGALSGVLIGTLCLWRVGRAWRTADFHPQEPSSEQRRGTGRRFWERGAGLSALLLSLAWLGAWGFCGRLGGIMVFGDAETNRAAAEAEAKRKNDAEAELPLRALDYASLEPVQSAPFKSASHGGRWVRTWVAASSIDAYKAGRPLPPGGYAVLSS